MSALTPKVMQKAKRDPVKNSTLFCNSRENKAATTIPMFIYPNLGTVSNAIPYNNPIVMERQIV